MYGRVWVEYSSCEDVHTDARASAENFPRVGGNGKKDRKLAKNAEK